MVNLVIFRIFCSSFYQFFSILSLTPPGFPGLYYSVASQNRHLFDPGSVRHTRTDVDV